MGPKQKKILIHTSVLVPGIHVARDLVSLCDPRSADPRLNAGCSKGSVHPPPCDKGLARIPASIVERHRVDLRSGQLDPDSSYRLPIAVYKIRYGVYCALPESNEAEKGYC